MVPDGADRRHRDRGPHPLPVRLLPAAVLQDGYAPQRQCTTGSVGQGGWGGVRVAVTVAVIAVAAPTTGLSLKLLPLLLLPLHLMPL